jgi:hypothetical protein
MMDPSQALCHATRHHSHLTTASSAHRVQYWIVPGRVVVGFGHYNIPIWYIVPVFYVTPDLRHTCQLAWSAIVARVRGRSYNSLNRPPY